MPIMMDGLIWVVSLTMLAMVRLVVSANAKPTQRTINANNVSITFLIFKLHYMLN